MKTSTDFLDYMKNAWQDTMMPLHSEEKKKKGRFINYFLGWPKSKSSFTDYLLNGGFLLAFYNILRRLPELVVNLLAELFGYCKNKMLHSDNKVVNFLSFLPGAVQGLFKASYLLLRIFTSPMISGFATAKYIDDHIENQRLKSFLLNTSIFFHALFVFGQILGLTVLGSMFFWPLLAVSGAPIILVAIDAVNSPKMNYSWNNSERKTGSCTTSESSDYTSTEIPEASSEYDASHYTSLFKAADNSKIDSTPEESNQNANVSLIWY